MIRGLLALLLLGLAASAAAQGPPDDDTGPPLDRTQRTRADYRAEADAALPPLDPAILMTPPGPDWLASFDFQKLGRAVGDTAPTGLVRSGPLLEASQGEVVMKADLDRGRLRYVNRARLFDWAVHSHMAFDRSQSLQKVLEALSTLEIPAAEYLDPTGVCNPCSVDTVMGQDYLGSDANDTPFSTHEAERMVTVPRHVGGYPVFDSHARMSVANDGMISRLLVRWAPFRLPTGLVMRPRAEILDEIAAGIWKAEFGAALDVLEIDVGYGRVGMSHLAVASVLLRDRESGAGFWVSLAAGPADADMDGKPDTADNCPQLPNPPHASAYDCNGDGSFTGSGEAPGEQCDRDGDGVGDACDNCPGTPNQDQKDLDGNGVGDACQAPEGACQFNDGRCERETRAHCLEEGGTYAGDGTTCENAGPDTDGDGVHDADDNCPRRANPGQEDTGGVGTAVPDGIGNACQCGDVTGNGIANGQDGFFITRRGLGYMDPLFLEPGNCDVNGNGMCNGQDGFFVTRAGLGYHDPPQTFGQNCPNAR